MRRATFQRRATAAANSARGFSLLEVLLATALLAAGLALAFSALVNAGRATEAAEAQARQAERLRAVQGFLRRQVEGSLPVVFEGGEVAGEGVSFEARPDRLRFVAPMPGYLSRGGPYLVEFRLVPGRGGRRLEFQHWLMGPEGPLEAEREPEVLLEGIAEGAFSVRSVDDLGQPGPWLDRWERPNEVPRLVRLELRFAEPRHRWPTLVAATRLGLSPLGGGDGGLPMAGDGQ